MTADDSPVFVGGCDRSGLALLSEMLERLPNLWISRRMNYWSDFYGRFGDLERPENLERCLDAMAGHRRYRDLVVDRDGLVEEFRLGQPGYGRLLAVIETRYARSIGKSRWGDKSIGSELDAHIIFSNFPDARFIHMIRDPRDRFASQSTHRGAGRGGAGAGAAMWVASARAARVNAQRYPGRYLVVRYEHLVLRPTATLGAVCRLIGEPYDEAAFGLTGGGSEAWQADLSSIGRYRRDLDPGQTALIESLAARGMAEWGYARPDERVASPQRILAALPGAMLGYGGWWIRHAMTIRTTHGDRSASRRPG